MTDIAPSPLSVGYEEPRRRRRYSRMERWVVRAIKRKGAFGPTGWMTQSGQPYMFVPTDMDISAWRAIVSAAAAVAVENRIALGAIARAELAADCLASRTLSPQP